MIADCPLALQKRASAQKLITCSTRAARHERDHHREAAGDSSPWANYITHLEKTHVTIDGGLVDMIATSRSSSTAARSSPPRSASSAAKLKKWLTTPDERPSAAFRDAAGAVLDRLWELARSSEHDAPAKGSPVEFVFTACSTMRHGYTIAEQFHAVFVPVVQHPQGAHCWRLIDSIENGEINTEPPMAPEPFSNATPSANRRT
ncbi:hypothetical protein EDB84DRAFT_1433790 [Lactarius hengduanensis]|nr:hypothetical protein EDB84DRAFT_1433790 [Lactarius hengduanensis]